MVAVDNSAIAVFDQPSPADGHWLSAVAGSPDAVRRILDGLQPPTGKASLVVTINAPDDPDLHRMLDHAGFEAATDVHYVIFEGPTGTP